MRDAPSPVMTLERSNAGWVLAGSVVLIGVMSMLFHAGRNRPAGEHIADQERALGELATLQSESASLADAEQSAVLARSEDSARALVAEAKRHGVAALQAYEALVELLAHGAPDERRALAQLDAAMKDSRAVDEQLLGLAGQNTNLKAYALAYGELAAASDEADAVLARIVGKSAAEARVELLQIRVLLPQHIADAEDAEMDALEVRIATSARRLERDLATIHDHAELRAPVERFFAIEKQIVVLSRENTNVRAFAISLNERRRASVRMFSALDALRAAIEKAHREGLPPRARSI